MEILRIIFKFYINISVTSETRNLSIVQALNVVNADATQFSS